MAFRVLGTQGADAAEWSRRVARLPPGQQDVHFLPEYARIYEKSYGHRALLALYGDDERYVLQSFVARRLNDLPFLASDPSAPAYFDLANPYGYGGPAIRTDTGDAIDALVRDFEREFVGWARDAGYATEFTSLHPRLDGRARLAACPEIVPERHKEVVYLDLAGGPETVRRKLRKGHKSDLAKARRHGATVARVTPTASALAGFNDLYRETMRRHDAAARWAMPEGYFGHCLAELGDERASLFELRLGGELAAASLLLHAFDTASYHFAASATRHQDAGVGTLLVFEMACWAASRGYRWMHLGGGVSSSPEDSLLRFKSGFSPLRAELWCYGRVLNEAVYAELCERKRRFEVRTCGAETDSDYFPLYRR